MNSKKTMDFRALVLTALVCCIGYLCDGREDKEVFGRVGGEVTLKPTVVQPITNITWKNGLNKAAEWDRNSNTDYYTRCNSSELRCRLNTATGELTIMQLTLNEKLDLSPEINGIAAQSFFSVIVLEPVSKPSVRQTCENNQCTLVCEGESTTYTKYSWKENNETTADDTITLPVQKSDKLDKIYTCVISNPVSSAESDPVKESDLFPGGRGRLILAVVSGICVAAVCGVIVLYCKKKDHPMNERPENTEDTGKFEDNNGEHVEMEFGP